MSKFDDFFKSFNRKEMCIGPFLKKGQKIQLYKNDYTVTSCDEKYTLLRDAKGTPLAYKTERLKAIMESPDIKKAQPCGPGKTRIYRRGPNGNYSYCVNIDTGAKVDEQGGEVPHAVTAEDQQYKNQIMTAVTDHAHPDDVLKLGKQVDDYVENKLRVKNLEYVQNQLVQEHGTKIPQSQIDKIANIKKNLRQQFEQLAQNMADSKRKNEGV